MKLFKGGALLALALVAMLAFAAPAFATPNTTLSNGVAPFITPAGNTTTSQITGSTSKSGSVKDSSFVLPGGGGQSVTCDVSGSGFIPSTNHTAAKISSLTFTKCVSTLGTVSNQRVTTSASVANPWSLHVRSDDSVNSAAGKVIIPAGGNATIPITALGIACNITVPSQSVTANYTWATTSLELSSSNVTFTSPGFPCPPNGVATYSGTASFTADTAAQDIRITTAS